MCGKKCYTSEKAVRIAHKRAHWRIRAYQCDECNGAWHATNNEKEKRYDWVPYADPADWEEDYA